MIELAGETLGKRQQELNYKVADIVKKKISFDDIKSLEEQSDLDRLYKIDVASHYRNINYIIEVFKCGDSLYVSRALKCDWIYEDEYSYVINPDYLHNEIFPHMSVRMKTKMITAIASHVRNEARAADFSIYCKNLKMQHFALKFLLFTSESFKLDLINEDCYYLSKYGDPLLFLGNSFGLVEAFLATKHFILSEERFINKLSYLYTVDADRYLDLLEKHVKPEYASVSFGCRLSKKIMTKHKNRVLKLPLLYVNKLKRRILLRYTTTEDAKTYITGLLPRTQDKFWVSNVYENHKYLFKLIPHTDIYQFLKTAFISKYGAEPFEMNYKFYYNRYYQFLTQDEKEHWALKHIEEGKEILGSNNDYIWYQFVNFGVAFQAIKRYIIVTPDTDMRNKMVMVLVDSVRNKQDLEALVTYYYNRHNNENVDYKKEFLNAVIEKNNIFECDESCWMVFNKILYSIEVYTQGFGGLYTYKLVCVIYNIIHNIEMPPILLEYINNNMDINQLKTHSHKLKADEWDTVYQYLFPYYFKKFKYSIKWDRYQTINDKVKYARYLIRLLECFKKTKEDMPEEASMFIKSEHSGLRYEPLFQDNDKKVDQKPADHKQPEPPYRLETLTEGCLMRLLKKEKQTIIELLPEISSCIGNHGLRLTNLIKKIRIYFSHDLAKDFLQLFENCLSETSENFEEWQATKSAIYGIFSLGDENSMLKLLTENVPDEPKIDHSQIDRKLLVIQEAICRFACYSRVPVPLANILQYIKGDYVFFCLPMFNRYLANLPLPLCLNFIEGILNAPLSVQKHAIRLAFKAFSAENLKNLIYKVWKNTKNVSLRMIIYNALFDKIINTDESSQDYLYDVLKALTITLHDEDQQEVFDLLVSYEIPIRFKGDYLQSAWMAVKQLPDKKSKNISIKINVLKEIEEHIDCMNRDFVKTEMIEEHVRNMLHEKGIQKTYTELETSFNDCLWNIAARYIVASNSQEEIDKSLALVDTILRESHNQWGYVSNTTYVVIKNCYIFIERLKERTELSLYKHSSYNVLIFEKIIECLLEFTHQKEIYMLVIDLKLFTIAKKVMVQEKIDVNIERAGRCVAEELVLFMNDLKNNNHFFIIFYKHIFDLISKIFRKMSKLLNLNDDLFLAIVANELVSLNASDTTLLALSLMPLNISTAYENIREQYRELCSGFIRKIKEINEMEIQSFYYNKFILEGFQKRFE